MRKKLNRPWLTASGVERPTTELKEISKLWDQQTWDEYLNWFETGRKDKIVSPLLYESIGDSIEKNVFEDLDQKNCPELQSYCDQILSALPKHQHIILRSFYLEGKTLVTIAAQLRRSLTNIHYNKNKALAALIREHDGENWNARRIMRGADVFISEIQDSIWDEKLSHKPCDQRSYAVSDHDKELLNHMSQELREVFKELSERSRQIIYLKFWCGLSDSLIVRKCSLGLNTVDQIIDATVFKIKSKTTANLTEDQEAA